MPSREEIVQALKIAAVSCGVFGEHSKAKGLKDLAAQVSAMRCGECKYYDKDYKLCDVVGMSELLIPPDFGCFHHKLKV